MATTNILVGQKLTPISISAKTASGTTVAPRNLTITVDDATVLNLDTHAPGVYSTGKAGTASVTFTSTATSDPSSAKVPYVATVEVDEDPIVELVISFPSPSF